MKVNSRQFLNGLNVTSVTKEDVVFAMKDGMAVLSSTDAKSGIQIKARFEVEGNEGENTYYVPCGVKEGVSALSSFGDSLDIVESAGTLKVKAGKTAKINVALLNKEPATIKTAESFAAYQLSGKEFMYAMNQAASVSNNINVVIGCDSIRIYGISQFRILRLEMTYLESKRLKEGNMTCETISETDEGDFIAFAISSEVWKRVSGVFDENFCVMHVAQGQLRFVWDKVAFIIPLTIDIKQDYIDKFEILALENSVVDVRIKDIKNLHNALSVALLDSSDGAVAFNVKENILELSSMAGSAAVTIDEKTGDKMDGVYNGKHLREIFNSLKNCNDLHFKIKEIKDKKLLYISTEIEYVYQRETGDDIIQKVTNNCMYTPIIR